MYRQIMVLAVSALFALAGCSSTSTDTTSTPTAPVNNNNGTPVTNIVTALFDPTSGVIPFPHMLLMQGTTDLTLNPPVADPTDTGDPGVALSALDGFGTITPWTTNFSGAVDGGSVSMGSSVRFFEVSSATTGAVTGVIREMTPGVDYVATLADEDTIAIVPLKPLTELTTYMVVLTEGLTDPDGNDVTPDQIYYIAKRTSPLVDASGNSTDPLLDNATASALEPLRQLTNAMEFAAAGAGVDPAEIVLSWSATTQGISPVLGAVQATTMPGANTLVPTGLSTAALGLPGVADLYIGILSLPYYLEAMTAENPLGPLTGFWEAAPGAYVPPFDAFGLDPTSTNITYANPFPVAKSTETIPVLLTVPNAFSGHTMPAAGWPVAIFQHGLTRNRADMLALADNYAASGMAVIAIDQPLHGITSTDPTLDPLAMIYAGNTPFAGFSRERTFDVDYVDNATGAAGSDGVIDGSGAHTINLSSLLTSRDNLRQAIADLWVLAATIPGMDFSGDGLPDFDGSRITFVGTSLGAIVGTTFLAFEPTVSTGLLSVPGGGILKFVEASPTFGPVVVGGLAAAGLVQGSSDFEAFMVVGQSVIDGGDPINHAARAAATNAIVLQEVIGGPDSLPDQVIPNAVAGAPLSGTEPMIAAMGLVPIGATTADALGVRGVVRFTAGDHGSLLSPDASLAATVEMQTEAISLSASMGTTVVVADPSVIVTE